MRGTIDKIICREAESESKNLRKNDFGSIDSQLSWRVGGK